MIPQQYVAVQTMSSREIAELTGKRHDHVMTDIRKMLSELGLSAPDFSGTYKTDQGNTYECFNLPKREALILTSGYSIKQRAAIIDRWQLLEAAVPAMTQAQILAAIANQAAEQEQRLTSIEQRVKALDAAIPREQDYFTVIGWARYIGITVSNSEALALGRKAAKYSRERQVSIGDTTDPRYGFVHTYHADVLDAAFTDYFDQKAA